MSKKKNLFLLVLVFTMLLVFENIGSCEEVLNILVWPNYYSNEVIEAFEEQNNVKINLLEFDDYSEVELNYDQADLLIFDGRFLKTLIDNGKVQRLNFSLIPNVSNVDPLFRNLSFDPNNYYTLPYHYVAFGIAFNPKKIKEDQVTLQALFEPSSEEFKGKIVAFPLARYNIGMALKYLGRVFNSTSEEDLDLAISLLKEYRDYFTPESKLKRGNYSSAIDISQGKALLGIWYYTNNDLSAIGISKEDFKVILPSEGSIIGVDAFAIPKNSKQVALAHSFINFFYSPGVAAQSTKALYYPTAVLGAKSYLSDELVELIYIPQEILVKSEIIDVLSAREEQLYKDIWNNIFAD